MGVSTLRGCSKLRPFSTAPAARGHTAAMDFKRLSQQAKRLIDKRGGTKSLKEDADELRDIARGEGSLSDKAKAAAGAVKDPGAQGGADAEREQPPQTPAATP
jgi:hypothetical protein